MRKRLLTGLMLVFACFLFVFVLPQQYFFIPVTMITGVCAWEWSRFVSSSQRNRLSLLLLFLLSLFIVPYLSVSWLMGCVVALSLWLCLAVARYGRNQSVIGLQYAGVRLLLGWLFLAVFWVAVIFLRDKPHGSWLLLFGLSMVWVVDSFAYFGGRLWGKHLLIPRAAIITSAIDEQYMRIAR